MTSLHVGHLVTEPKLYYKYLNNKNETVTQLILNNCLQHKSSLVPSPAFIAQCSSVQKWHFCIVHCAIKAGDWERSYPVSPCSMKK